VSGHGEKQARKQEQAIAALLSRGTITEAATEVGIGEATLRRWMQEPTFRVAYREARGEHLERVLARLLQASTKAVDALERNLETTDSPATEVRAAATLLRELVRVREQVDLSEHLEGLERRLAALESRPAGVGQNPVRVYLPDNGRDGPGRAGN